MAIIIVFLKGIEGSTSFEREGGNAQKGPPGWVRREVRGRVRW